MVDGLSTDLCGHRGPALSCNCCDDVIGCCELPAGHENPQHADMSRIEDTWEGGHAWWRVSLVWEPLTDRRHPERPIVSVEGHPYASCPDAIPGAPHCVHCTGAPSDHDQGEES